MWSYCCSLQCSLLLLHVGSLVIFVRFTCLFRVIKTLKVRVYFRADILLYSELWLVNESHFESYVAAWQLFLFFIDEKEFNLRVKRSPFFVYLFIKMCQSAHNNWFRVFSPRARSMWSTILRNICPFWPTAMLALAVAATIAALPWNKKSMNERPAFLVRPLLGTCHQSN